MLHKSGKFDLFLWQIKTEMSSDIDYLELIILTRNINVCNLSFKKIECHEDLTNEIGEKL